MAIGSVDLGTLLERVLGEKKMDFKIKYIGNGKYAVTVDGMTTAPLSYKEMMRELKDWCSTWEGRG